MNDPNRETLRIANVEPSGANYYAVTREDGWTFGVPYLSDGYVPKAGDAATFFGRGIGHTVRGVVIHEHGEGGIAHLAFYQTEAEERAKFEAQAKARKAEAKATLEKERASRDARWASLPAEYQARLARFVAAKGDDFRAEHESYELFCCEQAHAIASAMRAAGKPTRDDVAAFHRLTWEQQKMVVPALSDGHSGNTFGMACRLAMLKLEQPANVAREHGALVPLVGCDDYGCTHDAGPTH
jgi:hypothetical protein